MQTELTPSRFPLSFRTKLFIGFLLISVVPLLMIALVSSETIKNEYRTIIQNSFEDKVAVGKQLLLYFIENNKMWVNSLAIQDVPRNEILSSTDDPDQTNNTTYSFLVSIKRSNSYVERAYLLDQNGTVVVSTSTNDVGSSFSTHSEYTESLVTEQPYFGTVVVRNDEQVIPLSAPIQQTKGGVVGGVLVIELNSRILNALLDGTLFSSSSIKTSFLANNDTYVVDQNGTLLTLLDNPNTSEIISQLPVQSCIKSSESVSGTWENYVGVPVFGISECVLESDFVWALVIEQPISEAFASADGLRQVIFFVTVVVMLVSLLTAYLLSRSLTSPLRALTQSANEFRKGRFDAKLPIPSDKEFANLTNSFNSMATELSTVFEDLKRRDLKLTKLNKEVQQEKDKILGTNKKLERQNVQIGQSAKLLVQKDFELQQANLDLLEEKDHISTERNKLEVIISGISDAVIAVDTQRKVLLFNRVAEEMTGYLAEDVLNKPLEELIAIFEGGRQIDAGEYCPIRLDNYEGEIYRKNNVKLSVNNKDRFVNLIAGKIKEGSQSQLGCILTFHDVTKEQELEEMKLDFVSMAAHELRTPLTAIKGYLSILSEEKNDLQKEEYDLFSSRCLSAVQQLEALVENILNISKIEKGTLKMNLYRLDWIDLVGDVVTQVRHQANAKSQKIVFRRPKDSVVMVSVDKIRITEVLSNLMSNAVNYTPDKGKIVVSLEIDKEKHQLITHIKDTGIGIAPEAQKELFTKFFRVQGHLAEGSKGTGLGLYLSKSIVEMHYGSIWVESELGKGSTFSFSIPLK